MTVHEDGTSEGASVVLEYLTIDVIVNDYAMIVAGKFLSPIGQFRQNLHPSWINKLPSAPPGFGHGGAAPVSETGVQLRGGLTSSINYAVYVGNGPEMDIEVENEDGETEELEVHDVENEAFGNDLNNSKTLGGRIGWLPLPKIEIGASFMVGEADAEFEMESGGEHQEQMESADITVYGIDVVVPFRNFVFRGEYIKQELDSFEVGELKTLDTEWETFYLQGSYRFGGQPWELVLRYGDFDSPHMDDDQEQWAFGVNYLIQENAQVKIAYESNKNDDKTSLADRDQTIIQLAYGF